MNLRPWRNADADTKHDVIVMLVIHGLLIAMNLGLYLLGAYQVDEMIDGEAKAAHARLVLGIAHTIRNNFFFPFLPGLLAFAWLDAWVFLTFRKHLGKAASSVWNVIVVLLLISCTGFFFWGMNSELRRIEEVYIKPR
ncbi:MAG: hypothetical protein K0Q55_185 [Verrucomicrobia bacterium]|nr:hypothetical protein [Verrucomicrobiota bacterium]